MTRDQQIQALREAIFGTDIRPACQRAISRRTGINQTTISHWKKTPTSIPAVGLAKIMWAQELTDDEVLRIVHLLEAV